MNIWNILGIPETKDKEAIRAAYLKKLAVTNPEDSPEEFMELRRALEEALQYAEGAGPGVWEAPEGQWDDSPLGQWMRSIDELYNCFSRRIRTEEWDALLQQDVCQNLDTRLKARDMLLEYLMDHIFLPQSVVCLLDEHFSLQENMSELAEEFPQRFLDVVIIDSVKRMEYPPYAFLQGDDSLPFDDYLRLNARLMDCIGTGDTQQAEQIISEMEKTGIKSPFLLIDQAKVFCQEERFEEAKALIDGLLPQYGELQDLRLMRGDISFFMEDFQGARQEYEQALKEDPASQWARYGLGKCLVKEENYKEAGELFCQLLEEEPYDAGADEWLRECNNLYSQKLEKELETQYDEETALSLAWCWYQNEQYEKAVKLLEPLEVEDEHRIQKNSILGRSFLYMDQEKKALEYLENWENLLKELPDEGEDKERRQEQLPYILFLKSRIYSARGDRGTAISLLDQILEQNPDNGDALAQKGQYLYDMWELEKAADTLTKAIEKGSATHLTYLLRAETFYRMEYYGQAFDDCEKSMELYPYEFTAYRCKIKIFLDVGEIEAAQETVDYLEKEGLSGSEIEFLKGCILEAKGELEEAKKLYRRILSGSQKKKNAPVEHGENCFDMETPAEVYYRLALIEREESRRVAQQEAEAEGLSGRAGYSADSAIALIEKGMKAEPDNLQLLELKAEIAYECGHFEEVLDLCSRLMELAPGKIGIYGMMDSACREMEQWEKALEYANLQLAQAPSGYAYMRRGQLLTCLDRQKEAWEDFQKASELDPERAYIYNYMGVILEFESREEEALEYYNKAIRLGEEQEELCEEAYANAANVYCRLKRFGEAACCFQQIYEKTGEPRYLYLQVEPLRMGRMFQQAEEVLNAYREAAGLDRDAFAYIWERAHIYRDMGNFGRALILYEFAGREEPGALREAGKILLAQGNYKKALSYFTQAIEMLDEDHELEEDDFLQGEYDIWAAKTCLKLGKKHTARRFAQKALKKIPQDYQKRLSTCLPMVYQMLGGIYTILGDYERARQILQEALDIRRCDYCNYDCCIDALYEMGYLYEQQDNREQALRYYKEGIEAAPADADLACAAARLEKGKK